MTQLPHVSISSKPPRMLSILFTRISIAELTDGPPEGHALAINKKRSQTLLILKIKRLKKLQRYTRVEEFHHYLILNRKVITQAIMVIKVSSGFQELHSKC